MREKNHLLVLSKGQKNSWRKLTLINMNPQHIINWLFYLLLLCMMCEGRVGTCHPARVKVREKMSG